MKTTRIAATFASLALFASCSAPEGVTVHQYASMSRASSVPTAPITLQMSTKEPGKAAVQYPSQKLSIGRAFQIKSQKDLVYPSAYEPAEITYGSPAAIPATPKEFKTVKTGLVADLKSKRVGAWILVEGQITLTELQGFSRMGGALAQPIIDSKERIIITENRIEMPKFATYTTPVYAAIKPNDSCTFDLGAPKKGTKVTFTLNP